MSSSDSESEILEPSHPFWATQDPYRGKLINHEFLFILAGISL